VKRNWALYLLGFVVCAAICAVGVYAAVAEKLIWVLLLCVTVSALAMIMYYSSILFWWKSREVADQVTLKSPETNKQTE
jgi:hypothetical protein